MFAAVYSSELKYQLKSIVFWIFVLVTVVFVFTQFGIYQGDEVLCPQPGQSRYGYTTDLTPLEEMRQIQFYLNRDLQRGEVDRFGAVSRTEKISPEAGEKMRQLLNLMQQGEIEYPDFARRAVEIDRLLGGGTIYSAANRENSLYRRMNYQEALAGFRKKVEAGLTASYGRYFADYLGITAGLFPVFLAAFVLTRDRRHRMEELLGVRNINPLGYVGAKFLAVITLISALYLLISLQPTYAFYRIITAGGWEYNPAGFLQYTVSWVFPTMFFTTALGMLVSQVTGKGLAALVVQLPFWFHSINETKGAYSLSRQIIRFNSTGNYELYRQALPAIQTNRLFYLGASLTLILLTAWLWGRKRRV